MFRVRDTLRGSQLALKLSAPHLARWLRREFDTLRQIQHENLVRVFDWGLAETGDVFYTMELVVGSDWGARMGSPQGHEEVTRILAGVLRGLAHLHSHAEIHGDLKPGNVLLGKDGSIKLTDVGMGAARTGDRLSGTPGYAAPELWHGAPPDIRADVYSVGVMAYEALTGQHPFRGKTIRDVVSGQLEGWVPSPAAHGIRLPGLLEREIMRAIEREPTLRPGTPDEFMEGLGQCNRTAGILGGRFVARNAEVEDFRALLESPEPDSPTLVWIQGEGGIGKSAFVDEITARAIGRGIRVTRGSSLTDIGSFRKPLAPTFTESEAVWTSTQLNQTMFVLDGPADVSPASMEALRVLARYLHVIATERGLRCGALLVCEAHQLEVVSKGRFEHIYTLAPLIESEVGSLLNGYLGTVTVQPEVIRWLGSVSGGVPGRLASIIEELIQQGFLRRHHGRWSFAENQTFPSIERVLHRGKWDKSLERLSTMEQSVVAILSLLPQGLPPEVLSHVVGEEVELDSLMARGFLRAVSGRLLPASGEIRRAILDSSSRKLTTTIEEALLERGPTPLTREERAWLLLRNRSTQEALEEGLWAAQKAREQGNLRAAVELAKRCVSVADALRDEASALDASLLVAKSLHLLGSYDEAVAHLRPEHGSSPAAEELLGLIRRTQGDLENARTHLTNAVNLARVNGDSAVFLRGSAELAEVEWRHGDQRARESALSRLKSALSGDTGRGGEVDDRAALIYQLGAALVTTGKRDEGKGVLEQGLALSPSDYWRMRIANALGAAEYYLGNFEEALGWMDEAWRTAERGGFDSFKARIFSGRAGIHYGLGKFREAVEFHRLSSMWAARSGEQFEYMAACSGEAASQMLLGDYEQALKCAREAHRVACEIENEYEALKNLEMEGACLTIIGDYANARVVVEKLVRESKEFGESSVAPRALLSAGMLARVDGRWKDASTLLEEAERMLLESRDWEDLPVVQVELEAIRARENPRDALERVLRIVQDGARSGALIVQLRGCVVLGEILLEGGIDHREYMDTLTAGLGRAGEAGASEEEWRLHYMLAELSLRHGDRKAATIRLAQAVRVFRVIADRLSPEHRSCYLRTRHAARLLSRAS